MEKLNTTITRKYKNAEIVYIVEDDLITTGKVYVGEDNIVAKEYSCKDNEDGVPFNAPNAKAVLADLRADVDAYLEKCVMSIER